MAKESGNKLIKIGIIGTIIAALCCTTPILVVALGAVGLGMLSGYLDFVLLPALALFLLITIYGFWKRQKRAEKCCTLPKK